MRLLIISNDTNSISRQQVTNNNEVRITREGIVVLKSLNDLLINIPHRFYFKDDDNILPINVTTNGIALTDYQPAFRRRKYNKNITARCGGINFKANTKGVA